MTTMVAEPFQGSIENARFAGVKAGRATGLGLGAEAREWQLYAISIYRAVPAAVAQKAREAYREGYAEGKAQVEGVRIP